MAKKNVSCHAETMLAIVGGRWKVLILQQLFECTKRFNES
jgi:DNA-binding HxlR family transcriptional regulator